ncbi:MAG: hypothetical protein ACK2TT_03280 [Anaerolineales bacterium]
MFTANLIEFKTQQLELHRQAARYRLVRSLANTQARKSIGSSRSGRQPAAPLRFLANQPRAAH